MLNSTKIKYKSERLLKFCKDMTTWNLYVHVDRKDFRFTIISIHNILDQMICHLISLTMPSLFGKSVRNINIGKLLNLYYNLSNTLNQ